ncbi:MAG: hypothetical protein KDA92_08985 [Planctomycetales bacterium]|nr:hypothetical protein [Planctomycetales bacterium]MCA9168046.1 hypothetical protein [Planctomycetales bacterium]
MSTNPYEPPETENQKWTPAVARSLNRPPSWVKAFVVAMTSTVTAFAVHDRLEVIGVAGSLKHAIVGAAAGIGAAVALWVLDRR